MQAYEQHLAENLRDLCTRVHRGCYRAQPVRRTYIPKPDGGRRPLGIPALEDKIVQSALAEVLSAVYEADFLGFSYGFRPGRSPHRALAALHTALMSQRVSWVLDADIRRFFDSVDHEWLMRMVAHRIADPRVLRLIRMWLEAGILESGEIHETDRGTPHGAGASPLLANVFLHYVLDLWVHQWRRRHARGRVVIVRYCDDFVMGVESGSYAAAAKSTKSPSRLGVVRCGYQAVPVASRAHHSLLGRSACLTWVASGKSRMRESRTSGSVTAKPNGLATRPSARAVIRSVEGSYSPATPMTKGLSRPLEPRPTLRGLDAANVSPLDRDRGGASLPRNPSEPRACRPSQSHAFFLRVYEQP